MADTTQQARDWVLRYLNPDRNPGVSGFDTEEALTEAWLAGAAYRDRQPMQTAAGYSRRVIATAGQRKGQHGTVTGRPAERAGWYELVQWDGETVTNGYHKADLADEPVQDATDRIALLLHDLAEICDAAGTVRRPPAQIAQWIREGGPPRPAPEQNPQENTHG